MFAYANDLRNNTQGRGNFSMEFDTYTVAPEEIAEAVKAGVALSSWQGKARSTILVRLFIS